MTVVSLLFLLVAQAGAAALASRRQVLGGISGVAAATAGSSAGAAGPAKTVVVTGASSGIGFAAASELARRGHRCVLACRSLESAEETARRLPEGAVAWTPQGAGCELGDLAAVDAFADEVSKLDRVDGLLMVAGVDGMPRAKKDDPEPHFRVNYLGHALLARRLLPQLRASRGRVVTVTSEALLDSDLGEAGRLDDLAASRGVAPHVAYANSKASCVLLADALRAREPSLSVAACALPGRCATQIVRYELPQRAAQRATMSEDQIARQAKQLGLRTAAQGAALPIWLADSAEAAQAPETTLWLDPGVPARLDASWRTPATADRLWDLTTSLLAKRS